MKKPKYFLKTVSMIAITLMCFSVHAQTFVSNLHQKNVDVSVSPYSISLWGKVRGMTDVTVQHRGIFVTYLHSNEIREIPDIDYRVHRDFIGVGLNPASFSFKGLEVTAGFVYFNKKLPSKHYGAHFNFDLSTRLRITKSVFIQYKHMSNGFRIFQPYNPGVDNLGILIRI